MTTITYSKDLRIHQFSKEIGHCRRKINNFDTARKSSLRILSPFNWLIPDSEKPPHLNFFPDILALSRKISKLCLKNVPTQQRQSKDQKFVTFFK